MVPSECALSLSQGAHPAHFDELSPHGPQRMRPEPVEGCRSCAASTSSAHMLVLGFSTGSAHVLGYGHLDASRRGGDEMPEHRGLYWIRRGRIFRVPLDA